jgi:hypothetical protein
MAMAVEVVIGQTATVVMELGEAMVHLAKTAITVVIWDRVVWLSVVKH